MEYIDLIGLDNRKIDNYLIGEHAVILEIVELYDKGLMNINLLNVAQESLMNSTGYITKTFRKIGKIKQVTFENNLFPSNNLSGHGKTELEAICDACKNYFSNPQDYISSGTKYFDYFE